MVAYCLKENKPSFNLTDVELNSMIIAYADLRLVMKPFISTFGLTGNWWLFIPTFT
ncbi:hypothetical protein C427_0280 [Paraglaciecola psychrophila 170]|uniref:Uncharacterized protein n=1 Tax=Paraglaciecola psychrophila 170 TaxID=1129794 RepID=M4RFS1_9ALTE|nr:hypothetical protein C427_0280 [Paraglaciecola psychrophila 170]